MDVNGAPSTLNRVPAGPSNPTVAGNGARQAGTLYVLDRFESPDAHGNTVVDAARQAGFQGPVDTVQIQGRTADGEAILAAKQAMDSPDATKEDFLSSLDSFVVHKQTGLLHAATDALHGLSEGGAHDGAVNISRNENKAELAFETWNFLTDAEHSQALENAIGALGVDREQVYSEDPKVAGLAAQRLQQGLIDRISTTLDQSRQVEEARSEYGQAVEAINNQNVSVVVSSGNEGEVPDLLVNSAHGGQVPQGAKLSVPASFYDNPLSRPNVATVGAVEFDGDKAAVLPDSSPSKNVSVFANGNVLTPEGPEHGTSFSAPVVAATLARQHGIVPMSTQRAQAMLLQLHTTQQPGVPAPVVEPTQLADFLQERTF